MLLLVRWTLGAVGGVTGRAGQRGPALPVSSVVVRMDENVVTALQPVGVCVGHLGGDVTGDQPAGSGPKVPCRTEVGDGPHSATVFMYTYAFTPETSG